MSESEDFDISLLFPNLKFPDYDVRVKRLSEQNRRELEEKVLKICEECGIESVKNIDITQRGLEHLSFGTSDLGFDFEGDMFKTHNLGGPYLEATGKILSAYYNLLSRV